VTQVLAILAMAKKDFRIAISYRIGFATAIFGGFWGLLGFRVISKIVDVGQFHSGQTAYFDFTVIGIMVAFVIEPAATAGAAAVRADQVQGTLEYLASQPVSRFALGLSWSAYSVLQSIVVAIVVGCLTTIVGFRVTHFGVGVVVATLVLTIAIFASVGNFGVAFVLVYQQGGSLMTFFVGLCALLGGVLYPVSELPHFAQPFVHASPLTYALAALRTSLLSHQPATSVGTDLLTLVGFAAVLIPLSALALKVAFAAAQRRGSLSTF
jgi:ABC-2 type transport system permease protein